MTAIGAHERPTGRVEVVDAVLDAAERLFADAGPSDVSLRAIATEAGVSYGLVHRHFGTREVLVDRLLERYAERWTAAVDGLDYREALARLLGDSPEAGAYLRLLAWTLLSDRRETTVASHLEHTRLDELAALRGDGVEDQRTTAAALALIFGWRLFNPFIREALRLEGTDEELQRWMHVTLSQQISD